MPWKKKDSIDPIDKWEKNKAFIGTRRFFFKRKYQESVSTKVPTKIPIKEVQEKSLIPAQFDTEIELEPETPVYIKRYEDFRTKFASSAPKNQSLEMELKPKEIEEKGQKIDDFEFSDIDFKPEVKPPEIEPPEIKRSVILPEIKRSEVIPPGIKRSEVIPPEIKRPDIKSPLPQSNPQVKPLDLEHQPYLVGEAKKPPISIKLTGAIDISKMRDLVLEDLEQENTNFQQENQRLNEQNEGLREEAEKQLELIQRLKKTYEQATFENQKLAREKETLMNIREKLGGEKKRLEEEVSQLKGEKTNIVHKFQKLEVDISDFKEKHEELKGKLSGELKEKLSDIDAMRQMLEAKKLEAMKFELEVERLTKDNDELKFKAGLLDQKLSLKKLGLARDEDLQDDAVLEKKANKAVIELSTRINKLEESYKLKEIEYKARLQVYKRALGSSEKQGKMMAIEDLEAELRKKNDEIKAKTILIQDLESKISSGTVSTEIPRDAKKSVELSIQIVDLEKILTEQGLEISEKTMLINDLRAQLADSIEKITKFESDLQTLSLKAKATEQQVDTGALNELMLKMTQMRTPESELEKRLQEYGEQITHLFRENDLLIAQLNDMYNKLTELDAAPGPQEAIPGPQEKKL